MITVICGTNRPNSNSMKVAQNYAQMLQRSGADTQILNLLDVSALWIEQNSFSSTSPKMDAIIRQYIQKTNKLVLVVPEYNGSFPGIMKYFIDGCTHGDWAEKKIALVGVASGRSGNLRGLDHLTGIFHYLGSSVFWRKVYISQISNYLNSDGELTNDAALKEIQKQIDGFLAY